MFYLVVSHLYVCMRTVNDIVFKNVVRFKNLTVFGNRSFNLANFCHCYYFCVCVHSYVVKWIIQCIATSSPVVISIKASSSVLQQQLEYMQVVERVTVYIRICTIIHGQFQCFCLMQKVACF